ncbi:hypothetical protein DVH24_017110 [Malus domestica]|uniref:RNase H type-1 domain-containing protein n=1 Tax=Malus domestica TaxID=3750 RepID=A0A498IV62_MALDO|nr:hypothetical protein DVH24_017110 [Malus domestica]
MHIYIYSSGLNRVLFLTISTFTEFLCILLYAFYFPRLPIVKYYRSKAASEGSKTVTADLAAAGVQTQADIEVSNDAKVVPTRLSTMQIFKQNIDFCLDLFLIYVLTLSIFPGFIYENTGNHQLGTWYFKRLFSKHASYPLVLVAMYNVLDLISRYIPLIKCLKIESRKGLLIAILLRFLFVPAYYFTAKYADQGWMILLTSILGLTNGYLTVCVMTVAPKGYNGPEQNALGNILVLFLLGGIFAGVCLDWLWLIAFNKILRFEKLIQQRPVCLFGSLHKESIPVSWEKPKIGWTKLNFDGSSKPEVGKASIGGLFRNHKAEFLLGYAESIGKANSIIAELAALRRGLELVLENGWSDVWLEGDAKTLLQIIAQRRQIRCAEAQRQIRSDGNIYLLVLI